LKTVISTRNYNRFIIIITGFTLFVLSCISSFEPDYMGKDNLLVVDGSIIKGLDKQVIKISRSASIIHPKYAFAKYQPEENCLVKIRDDIGNEFIFKEESKGKYVASINDNLLNYGSQYKLIFSTPSGENYESGYQQILETAPVDNIYSIKESRYSPEFNKENIEVLQFYADLNAPDDAPKYYKWLIDETWEIHATSKIFGYYDGTTVRLFDLDNPSDSLYYCWDTRNASGIYTSSTITLSDNIIKKIPLHYKLSSSKELIYKYCATAKLFALNKDAYDYWRQKEIELNESGEIYSTQPYQIKSNIFNTGNPEEKVLGFFWASSCTFKRHFVENPFNNTSGPDNQCKFAPSSTSVMNLNLLNFLYSAIAYHKNMRDLPLPPPVFFNIFYTAGGGITVHFSKDECLDCRVRGGNTKKPDFWQ
jgi:hypothetical protein